jgi:DNA-binding NtrC family response regulator
MNTAAATGKAADLSTAEGSHAPVYATVLIATVDPDIRREMRELLEPYPVRVLWAKGVEEVRWLLSKERITVCFCGFWLVDGTYRDVVRHLRSQPVEIPSVIVCAPDCPHEYTDYLAALKIRAFDFICHPYRKAMSQGFCRWHLAPISNRRGRKLPLEESATEMRQSTPFES